MEEINEKLQLWSSQLRMKNQAVGSFGIANISYLFPVPQPCLAVIHFPALLLLSANDLAI